MKIVKIIAKILAYLVLVFLSTTIYAGVKCLVLLPGNLLMKFKRAGYEPNEIFQSREHAYKLGISYARHYVKDGIEGYKWFLK